MEKLNFDIDEVLEHYLETLLWTEEELDEYSICDIDVKSVEKSRNDIIDFIDKVNENSIALIESETYEANMFGHNFALSRNGHGAGFFDDYNDELQNIARECKSVDIVLGDDGKVYIE